MTNPATIVVNQDKLATWIKNGAKPTESVKTLLEKAN